MADVACRYDGATVRDGLVVRLGAHVDWVRVCPEVRVGLGVPRDPIRVVTGGSGLRLVQPATRRDLTAEMRAFAEGFLDGLGPVDGFLLKARSPSCGPSRVKVHAPAGRVRRRGSGFFARAALERFPDLPVEDEERLSDPEIRHRFLLRAFGSARLRAEVGSSDDLPGFHRRHALLLLAHDPASAATLDRLVDGAEAASIESVLPEYRRAFVRALARAPLRASFARAVERAVRLAPRATAARERVSETLAAVRAGALCVPAATAALSAAASLPGGEALAQDALARPYPAPLLAAPGEPSARGRG
jgi:uncharacterized protein YbbK (DUF523 family)/uncharacterized protein YbgA (DUF1722 family)